MKKKCSRCLVEKDIFEFHKHRGTNDGYYTICKICRKPIEKKYYDDNKKVINLHRSKKYYENHEENLLKERERAKNEREKRLERAKIYYKNNREKIKEYQKKHYELNKEKYIKKSREWGINNRERRNKIRKKEDILFKLKTKLKTDIYISLKRRKKSKKLENIIGLSLDEYKKYIENQFEEWMTWENWGVYTWHIDHIIPLSAQENLKKGKKF
jgi:hypothetical protein